MGTCTIRVGIRQEVHGFNAVDATGAVRLKFVRPIGIPIPHAINWATKGSGSAQTQRARPREGHR